MFNLENLPGVISQVNDYNLGNIQESSAASTESVLILGTTIDGPKGIPLPIRSISDAIALYGDFKDINGTPNGSTLIRGIVEAYKSGCRDIRAMRITGKLATRTKLDNLGNANAPMLTGTAFDLFVEAKFEGSLYNNVTMVFDHVAGTMVISKPASKLTQTEKQGVSNVTISSLVETTFKYADFNMTSASSLSDFIRLVNVNINNNVVKFKIVDGLGNDLTNSLIPGARALVIGDIKSLDVATPIVYGMTGGDEETALDSIELYKRLGGFITSFTMSSSTGLVTVANVDSTIIDGYENAIYDLLVNYRTDNIVLMDGYADQDLCAFKNEDGSAKLAVTETEFMAAVPTSRPSANIILAAPATSTVTGVVHAAGAVVAKIYATVLHANIGTAAVVIAVAAGATGTVVKAGNVYTITPALTKNKAKDIYTLISNCELRNEIAMELLLDDSVYTEVVTLTSTPLVAVTNTLYSTTDNFSRQLAQACAVISSKNNECIGVIGCSSTPATDLVALRLYVNSLLGRSDSKTPIVHVATQYDLYLKSADGQKIYNDGNKPIDIGGYINIVAAPELVFADGVLGAYAATGAAAYAGLISTLPAEYSTTNRTISGAVVPRFELSGQQLNDLTGAGYVTFRTNYNNGLVVTDGITAAGLLSDFQRLTTKRITNAAMHLVRRVCEPFIGLPNSLAQRNALSTAIQAGLDGMKQAGAIQDSSFEVFSSKRDQVLGNALIDLTIVPVFEFRKIRVYVNLKAPV